MSDCACLYTGGTDYMPDFCSEHWVTPREEHRCCECRRLIYPGERHHKTTGRWDGAVSTYRTCAPCHDVRVSLCCDGWTFGTLWQDVTDQLFAESGLTGACLATLGTPEGKRYLSERWWGWVNKHNQEGPRGAVLLRRGDGLGRARAGIGGGGLL